MDRPNGASAVFAIMPSASVVQALLQANRAGGRVGVLAVTGKRIEVGDPIASLSLPHAPGDDVKARLELGSTHAGVVRRLARVGDDLSDLSGTLREQAGSQLDFYGHLVLIDADNPQHDEGVIEFNNKAVTEGATHAATSLRRWQRAGELKVSSGLFSGVVLAAAGVLFSGSLEWVRVALFLVGGVTVVFNLLLTLTIVPMRRKFVGRVLRREYSANSMDWTPAWW